MTKTNFKARFGVKLWGRLKDDILLIISPQTQQRTERLLDILRMKSRFFKLKVEDISSTSIVMLDLVIYKGVRWQHTGFLDFRVHQKSSSLYTPLSTTSAHPAHVHIAWPRSMARRFKELCTNRKIAHFLLRDFDRQCVSFNGISLQELDCKPIAPRNNSCVVSHVVLPYFGEWEFARFRRALRQCGELSSQVRIAFKLGGRHLTHRVQAVNSMLGNSAACIFK